MLKHERDRRKNSRIKPAKILFVCTLNSVRSVFAEKIFQTQVNASQPGRFEVYSAGVEAQPAHPLVVTTLAEVGIDCRDHAGQELVTLPYYLHFNQVITLSTEAFEYLKPLAGFSYDTVHHWQGIAAPSLNGNREQQLAEMRNLRDSIAIQLKEHFLL
jgi:protein-tyrosine-phosphatase